MSMDYPSFVDNSFFGLKPPYTGDFLWPPLKSEGYPSPPAARPTAEKLAEDALRRLMPPGNSTFPWEYGVPYSMYGHLFYAGGKGI